MISSKSYFSREPDAETAYRRIISLFLQGSALHAVEGDKAEFDQFRDDLDRLSATLSPETPASELLVAAGRALRAMGDYNQRTSRFVRRQSAELQNMSPCSLKPWSIGSSSEHSVGRLLDIGKSFEMTQAVEDIQVLKLRSKDCLEAVREEAQRQKQDGQTALVSLRQELESSRERIGTLPLAPEKDAATGLSGKVEADRAIRTALLSPAHKFLAVAVCNRLVALLDRTERIERVRAEIRSFADARLEKTIDVGQRTVLAPISAAWVVFAVEPPLDVFLKQVEILTVAQLPHASA